MSIRSYQAVKFLLSVVTLLPIPTLTTVVVVVRISHTKITGIMVSMQILSKITRMVKEMMMNKKRKMKRLRLTLMTLIKNLSMKKFGKSTSQRMRSSGDKTWKNN